LPLQEEKEKARQKKLMEKKVSFFDPVANAYREMSVAIAKEYVKGLEAVKKQIAEIDGEPAEVASKPAK